MAETFLTPASSAVYDQYSFVIYRLAVQATGAHALVAASNPVDHAQPLGHDLEALRALVDESTRLGFHRESEQSDRNMGGWQSSLRAFLESLPDHVIAVVDEAYYEYACDPHDEAGYPDTLSWLDEFPNLVIVRTFSKAYGLAGFACRLCYSAPGIAELLNRVRQPFNVNSVAQAGRSVAAL